MLFAVLFVFGLAIGSFLNVVSMRYGGDHFVFDPRIIGGRSRCPHCGKTLRWFELIPLVSFIIQGGRCRRCGARLSLQYPIVESISAALFVLVPWRIVSFPETILWLLAFFLLLLMSAIDARTGIVPDELCVALGILAVLIGALENALPSRIIGAAFGFAFFEILFLATRGKGIGMGDVKLALPIGFLFGWPDILLVVGFAFVCGALVGVILIALKKKTIKGTLPFGPFFALGAAITFFFGAPLVQWYLKLIGL